jgi:luciferase family oxidoreductase group 1
MARLTAETTSIRLGTGGIMLPHYSAFKVAESFRMLEALAPGRIDLGLGRAPGGMPLVSAALESRDPALFRRQIERTIGFLNESLPNDDSFASLTAMPSGATAPAVWILGSSEYGALLAADMGLPYAYAHFIGGDAPAITRAYRSRFRPANEGDEPRSIMALAAIVAPTDEEAEELALPVRLWRARVRSGISGPLPSLEEARAYRFTARESDGRRVVTGSPERAKTEIEELVAEHDVDEAMIVTITADYASRMRSYQLLAREFARVHA